MCKINNKENNQQLLRSTPSGTQNQGATSDSPPADPHHQFRFIISNWITETEARNLLEATRVFDNTSFTTDIDDNWTIGEEETLTTACRKPLSREMIASPAVTLL